MWHGPSAAQCIEEGSVWGAGGAAHPCAQLKRCRRSSDNSFRGPQPENRCARARSKRCTTCSVDIRPEWAVVEQIPFASLAKLSTAAPAAEDVTFCGALQYYDKAFDRITPKEPRAAAAHQARLPLPLHLRRPRHPVRPPPRMGPCPMGVVGVSVHISHDEAFCAPPMTPSLGVLSAFLGAPYSELSMCPAERVAVMLVMRAHAVCMAPRGSDGSVQGKDSLLSAQGPECGRVRAGGWRRRTWRRCSSRRAC